MYGNFGGFRNALRMATLRPKEVVNEHHEMGSDDSCGGRPDGGRRDGADRRQQLRFDRRDGELRLFGDDRDVRKRHRDGQRDRNDGNDDYAGHEHVRDDGNGKLRHGEQPDDRDVDGQFRDHRDLDRQLRDDRLALEHLADDDLAFQHLADDGLAVERVAELE